MDHDDHVRLIREGVVGGGPTWADIGSGDGAFTLALADVLGPAGTIYSVDRDRRALARQAEALRRRFPAVALHQIAADYREPLGLPPLDGIVMANSLHFVADQAAALRDILRHLVPGGRFVLVEYDTDHGNAWVPHPISYRSWAALSAEVGLGDTRRLATVPSRFLRAIYAAVSVNPDRSS